MPTSRHDIEPLVGKTVVLQRPYSFRRPGEPVTDVGIVLGEDPEDNFHLRNDGFWFKRARQTTPVFFRYEEIDNIKIRSAPSDVVGIPEPYSTPSARAREASATVVDSPSPEPSPERRTDPELPFTDGDVAGQDQQGVGERAPTVDSQVDH